MLRVMKLMHQMMVFALIQRRLVLLTAQALKTKMMTLSLILFLILISMILIRIVLRSLFKVIKFGLHMMMKMVCLVITHIFRNLSP